MPRKSADPIISVIRYFEEAPVDVAASNLTVLAEIVRRRREQQPSVPGATPAPAPKKKSHHKRKPTIGSATSTAGTAQTSEQPS